MHTLFSDENDSTYITYVETLNIYIWSNFLNEAQGFLRDSI